MRFLYSGNYNSTKEIAVKLVTRNKSGTFSVGGWLQTTYWPTIAGVAT